MCVTSRPLCRSVGRMPRHPSFPSEPKSERKICACAAVRSRYFFCATVAVVATVFCAFRWCRLAESRVASPRTRHIFSFGIGFVRGRFRTTQIELSTAGNYGFDASIAVYGGIGNCAVCLNGLSNAVCAFPHFRFQVQCQMTFRRKSRGLSPKSVLCQSLFAPP